MTDQPYRAFVLRSWENSFADTVRLYMRRRHPGSGRVEYLLSDGTWRVVDEGTEVAEAGLLLPAEAVEAIAVAIEEFQGHTSHADTEARVLREWLAVEQRRVDEALRHD